MLSPLLQRLLFVRQFGIDKGKIDILGGRYILLDDASILELQQIDETKLYDLAKKSSFKNLVDFVQHAKVYKNVKETAIIDIARLGKRIGDSDEGSIKTLQEIFNIFGLGELHIIDLNNKDKKAKLRLSDSSIAHVYVERHKKSKEPVCTITSGILAGMFSFIFDKEVDCVETSCLAQGKQGCEFVVGS